MPRRCAWADLSPAMGRYHDREWGWRARGDAGLFERIVLEGAQAGLSWATILAKRPAYRKAFAGFRPAAVAAFTARDERRLFVFFFKERGPPKILPSSPTRRSSV